MRLFAAHSELFAAPSAACSKHTTAVCRSHAFAEAMFVFPFALRGLERAFHCIIVLNVVCLKNGVQI